MSRQGSMNTRVTEIWNICLLTSSYLKHFVLKITKTFLFYKFILCSINFNGNTASFKMLLSCYVSFYNAVPSAFTHLRSQSIPILLV